MVCGIALAVAAHPGYAAGEPRFLGEFGDWSAYVVTSGSDKHCFAYSEPAESKGSYTVRGKVSLTVSHRPKDNVRNEISLAAGYTYKPESEAEMTIDGNRRFLLFVDGGSAWAQDDDDSRIRQALEKGAKMVVRGRSARGTLTTDAYSLTGASAALARIDKECGVAS
jgi:hypothetical protein